jgi:hypothetical protein
MSYKQTIEEIKGINWKTFEPLSIIIVSYFAAKEFADSLRVVLRAFPVAEDLHKMGDGELNTDNMQFGGYSFRGDHWQFLEHFLNATLREPISPLDHKANKRYRFYIDFLQSRDRGVTIYSREQELPHIFREILAAHDWEGLGLGFFQYYLNRHIELDSQEGGHADLVKSYPLSPDVLGEFWAARLKLYKEVLQPLGSLT